MATRDVEKALRFLGHPALDGPSSGFGPSREVGVVAELDGQRAQIWVLREQGDEVDAAPTQVGGQHHDAAARPEQSRDRDAGPRQLDLGRQLRDHLRGKTAEAAGHDGRVTRPVVAGLSRLTERRPVERGHPDREMVDLNLEPQPGDPAAVGRQQHPRPARAAHQLGLQLVDEPRRDEAVDEVGGRGPGQPEGAGDPSPRQRARCLDDRSEHERQIVSAQRLLSRRAGRGQERTRSRLTVSAFVHPLTLSASLNMLSEQTNYRLTIPGGFRDPQTHPRRPVLVRALDRRLGGT